MALFRYCVTSLLVLWMGAVSWNVFSPVKKDRQLIGFSIQNNSGRMGTTDDSISFDLPLPIPIDLSYRSTICIRVETHEGSIELLDPAKWSPSNNVNRLLDRIVVFEPSQSTSLAQFQWVADEAEAEWTLTILRSTPGFSLTRKSDCLIDQAEIDRMIDGGFNIICPSPKPLDCGGCESF